MNTSEQTSASREPGLYFVSWHHSTNWFPAQWTGIKWIVNDEDGHPDFHKDADFDFIDERRIERPTPQQQPDTDEALHEQDRNAVDAYIKTFNSVPYPEEVMSRWAARWGIEYERKRTKELSQPDELSKAQARIRELEELINEAVLCLPIGEPFTAWKNKVREYKNMKP